MDILFDIWKFQGYIKTAPNRQCFKEAAIAIFPRQSVTVSPGWQLGPVNIYCEQALQGQGSTQWLSWLYKIMEAPISHGNFSLKIMYKMPKKVSVTETRYCNRKKKKSCDRN